MLTKLLNLSLITLCLAACGVTNENQPIAQTQTAVVSQQQPSATAIEAALELARNFSGNNRDWQPFVWSFDDGVEMVLVPAGCFMMGSTDEQAAYILSLWGGSADWVTMETPAHEICFDTPFWMDKYEVTQASFERLGGQKANANYFVGSSRPVENITWLEARDFCRLRGTYLPTEAEWEYAARGPDSLEFPWGNEWTESNVVRDRSESDGTANVGSIPIAASWVGALDMSGNVSEWTTSQYVAYPYDARDGREPEVEVEASRDEVLRVQRGGGWNGDFMETFRTAHRLSNYSGFFYENTGFRCARPM